MAIANANANAAMRCTKRPKGLTKRTGIRGGGGKTYRGEGGRKLFSMGGLLVRSCPPFLGTFKQGVSKLQAGGNDICMATGIAVRCRRDARCRQCTQSGKRLSRTLWSSFNKERMSHLCDSAVAGLTARGRRMRIPPFPLSPFSMCPTPLFYNPPFGPG